MLESEGGGGSGGTQTHESLLCGPTVLNYIIDGRAGKMEAASNGLFLLQKLRNNLFPADGDENVVAERENFVPVLYGLSQCSISASCMAYPSNHLSQLKKQAQKHPDEVNSKTAIACRLVKKAIHTVGLVIFYPKLKFNYTTMKTLAGDLKGGDGIRHDDVKYIVPQSAAMPALDAKINSR